jgi:hypothetical protein
VLYLNVDVCDAPTDIYPGKRYRNGTDHLFDWEAQNVLVDNADVESWPAQRCVGRDPNVF